MKKLTWKKTIGGLLHQKTQFKEYVSKKGTTYSAEVVPEYACLLVGSPTEKMDMNNQFAGEYEYEVYDPKYDLGGFSIVTSNLIEFQGLKQARFINVRGGELANKPAGWFKADKVELIEKGQK